MMNAVWVVQHLHRFPSGEENVKFIGVYRSREAAEAAVGRLRPQPGFRNYPRIVEPGDDDEQGFYLSCYPLDKDHWTEGFVTV
jgi:homoserine kinase type II